MTKVLAIDGPAGAGKSTVARAAAAYLGWRYLDTGAMYRALTFKILSSGIDLRDTEAMTHIAAECEITLGDKITINGDDVTAEIRSERINSAVSLVAAVPEVRSEMVRIQRKMASTSECDGIVVEGRDIGTVVFPEATLKVYLTASLESRSARRHDEGVESIARRDVIDTTRSESPLRPADDAITIDSTEMTVDEVVQEIVSHL